MTRDIAQTGLPAVLAPAGLMAAQCSLFNTLHRLTAVREQTPQHPPFEEPRPCHSLWPRVLPKPANLSLGSLPPPPLPPPPLPPPPPPSPLATRPRTHSRSRRELASRMEGAWFCTRPLVAPACIVALIPNFLRKIGESEPQDLQDFCDALESGAGDARSDGTAKLKEELANWLDIRTPIRPTEFDWETLQVRPKAYRSQQVIFALSGAGSWVDVEKSPHDLRGRRACCGSSSMVECSIFGSPTGCITPLPDLPRARLADQKRFFKLSGLCKQDRDRQGLAAWLQL
ncbi:hypothetical protein LshimejAT787_1205230 [Lyophyllum shimeji]|uniref:Uncharacterized protein n=1 Tax=Lyophyllum shimeji TaxID=47721 RepID=A0A9P3UPR5_LYOSH|nr:hypothetical protein LshimejAT787_0101750 [Lyophyllum shimeji]GLB43074.1 hypothetical protein LshimejAT787_1205230 [Lyophyllum shimeji]